MLAKSISGAAAAASPVFVEDTFSSYLYTGNGSTQTITNGIDLSGKGGLVWTKIRSAADRNALIDSARGINKLLNSDASFAQATQSNMITALTATGYTLGTDGTGQTNLNNATYVSWTFRKQAKFFDVVTYTGNGANRTIAHNLGSVPGCIIVKRTDTAADWQVYHRSLANTEYLVLNSTAAKATGTTRWNSTTPTSTVFSLGTDTTVNANGGTYVAYLFAHDAGGFGASGSDNVISCGSVTSDANRDVAVTLGWEPQWVLFKRANAVGDWNITDSMRGLLAAVTGTDQPAARTLAANAATAENNNEAMGINATGFREGRLGTAGDTYIYIAIRRPNKPPTSGTQVFAPVTYTGNDTFPRVIDGGITEDLSISKSRIVNSSGGQDSYFVDRLRGALPTLSANNTSAEDSPNGFYFDQQTGVRLVSVTSNKHNNSGITYIHYSFRRAPGFFDVVCYTGTGVDNTSVTHNLGVAPELIITKKRSATGDWWTLCTADAARRVGRVNLTNAFSNSGIASIFGNGTAYVAPTATQFTLGSGTTSTNTSGATYVAYLFASCPGVSKVGSYTGTGTTQQINCGFTGGARFVLIKRTDSTGDWYVWDSARGIVAGNDPYLLLNSTAAEVTSTDYIDTYSAGFEISSTAPADINANGGTYIFLAVA